MNGKLKLFALLTTMAALGCANGSSSSKDDLPPAPPPALEMVQPASRAEYLEVDQPVVLRFNEPLSPDGYQLHVDGSPPIDRSTHLYSVDDQYPDVDEVILNDRGMPIEFRFGALTFRPLCGRWRHDADYELTVNFKNDNPAPIVYSFRTPPAPDDPTLSALKGKSYHAVGLDSQLVCVTSPCGPPGFILSVQEIDEQGVVLQSDFTNILGPNGLPGPIHVLPSATFKSGGVFTATEILTDEEAAKGRFPKGTTMHLQGEITSEMVHFMTIWYEFDCSADESGEVWECRDSPKTAHTAVGVIEAGDVPWHKDALFSGGEAGGLCP